MTLADANERARGAVDPASPAERASGPPVARESHHDGGVETAISAVTRSDAYRQRRYRMHRAGIRNVWQYDDHTFRFADGRLLLRGRNGTGKSKALEMLLPFLLDGDSRRLDTTGTSRTSLRWLMLEGRAPPEEAPDTAAADTADDPSGATTSALGYLWVEFVRDADSGAPSWLTLGAAITASPGTDARSVFFVTDRRIGVDLHLVTDRRPMPIDRLRAEVGDDNCFDSPVAYRARVMRELFGIDDPVRYRNLVHLLYRLRRPTIGERLEAGELVSVLAEALPPMDETVLDQVARNISELDRARSRLTGLRAAREQVTDFLTGYHGYLRSTLRAWTRDVRTQMDAYQRRDAEVARLEGELNRLVSAEGAVQEERDRLRRTRDTAASDAATLSAGASAGPTSTDHEQQARSAAVTAYIRAAEAAWKAAEYANTAEERAEERLAAGIAAIDRHLSGVSGLRDAMGEVARAGGIDPAALGDVPQPVPTVLVPRESTTHVDLEGLEQSVERAPVAGIDLADLRRRLAGFHDALARADARAAERAGLATHLHERARERVDAEQREAALAGEAESADAALERAHERERGAIEGVRAASADYAAQVRAWSARLREAAPNADLDLDALEGHVELPLDDALRVVEPDVPTRVERHAHEMVDPLLRELRGLRDTAVGEERELAAELDELSDQRTSGHAAPPQQPWPAATRDDTAGLPLHRAVDFVADLGTEQRAGLEAALEGSGLLSGWIAADGQLVDPGNRDLLLSPTRPARGRTLLDVLTPVESASSGVSRDTIADLLHSIGLLPATGEGEPEAKHRREGVLDPPASSAVSLDGRWRLGVASGTHHKSVAEYIGDNARTEASDRHLANVDRRIAIAEALLAEAGERRGDIERQHARIVEISRSLPAASDLSSAWAVLENARSWLADAKREHTAAQRAAADARDTVLRLRSELRDPAERYALPSDTEALAGTSTALARLRAQLAAANRDLDTLAALMDGYQRSNDDWERARADRIVAEDVRGAAIGDMITVRREIELTDRARAAGSEQIGSAVGEVRARREEAATRLPELERSAQQARDDRVAAETRLDTAISERAEQARRARAAGAELRAALRNPDGRPDTALLAAAGLTDVAEQLGEDTPGAPPRATGEPADREGGEGTEDTDALAKHLHALNAMLTAMQEDLGGRADPAGASGASGGGDGGGDTATGAPVDDSGAPPARTGPVEEPGGTDTPAPSAQDGPVAGPDLDDSAILPTQDGPVAGPDLDDSAILRRREVLHRALAAEGAAGARTEVTEPSGIKRLTVHDDDGTHDITAYAAHLDRAIAQAEEDTARAEEEAFERHLLGELAGHLSRQIDEARSLISTMNHVLGEVTTSQGIGVRLDWSLAPDADEDIQAVVPLLARTAEQRTRVETTRLRDALRRCIEAIRRLDPTATSGAQLRAALDYRSWFAFTVYVTDSAHPERERRLSHRTALSQGEQRVVAYLVLFAAAAAQFDSLAAQAPTAPRLILLDDAFAKVDEPTHGRLLGLLVELDLDFVLTSERVWGCFPSVPSLHIYECLRDPSTPGIDTLHFTWDGNKRRLVGV